MTRFVAAMVALGLFVCLTASTAGAVDMQVVAKVCGVNPGAAILTVTQPIDDSVVDQPTVTIRGTVQSTAQVLVELDGAYNNTIAIGADQTTFQTNITLAEGTHTITLTANEVCGGADAVKEVAVTYQPTSLPSTGEQVPTQVAGQPTIISTADGVDTDEGSGVGMLSGIKQLPILGPMVTFASGMINSIGLEATVTGGDGNVVAGVARVGLTVAALTSVVMATTLAPAAIAAVPGVSELFSLGSSRSMIYLEWIIRGIGAFTMAIVYFL